METTSEEQIELNKNLDIPCAKYFLVKINIFINCFGNNINYEIKKNFIMKQNKLIYSANVVVTF